ncbi:TPA: hypothetical protein ACV1O5_004143, partial [Yersinia enterocolitica]
QLFTYTDADKLSDSQVFAKNQWIEEVRKNTGWSKESIEALGLSMSLAGSLRGKKGGSLNGSSRPYSAISGLNLNKSLASEAQLVDLAKKGGTAIAGYGTSIALRDSSRLVAEYGGKAESWSKVSSKSYKAADGTAFEIHAYHNVVTGQLVEPKTIVIKK